MRKRPPDLEKYVDAQYDRGGRMAYTWFRRWGCRHKLPSKYRSPEWYAAYAKLLAATDKKAKPLPTGPVQKVVRGTFGALVNEYLHSPEFKNLKPRTQAEYQRISLALADAHGQKAVKGMERKHVRQIRDAKADTPGAANTIVRMLKILLNFAVDDGLLTFSPAAKMKELRVGEWRDGSDAECAKFEKHWAPGTMQRRAYALALYTGQRLSDVVRMTRSHRENGLIRVVTQKTREELWIPEHSKLTIELSSGVVGITHLLTTPTQGKPFDPVYFGAWFADAIEKAGLPEDCVLHGLRKCAARTLADLGCTTEQIKAIIGHRTDRMVSKYTKTADKKRRAKDAMAKWEQK